MPGSAAGAEAETRLLSDGWCMVLAGSRASMAAQVDDAFTAKKEALKVSPLPVIWARRGWGEGLLYALTQRLRRGPPD